MHRAAVLALFALLACASPEAPSHIAPAPLATAALLSPGPGTLLATLHTQVVPRVVGGATVRTQISEAANLTSSARSLVVEIELERVAQGEGLSPRDASCPAAHVQVLRDGGAVEHAPADACTIFDVALAASEHVAVVVTDADGILGPYTLALRLQ